MFDQAVSVVTSRIKEGRSFGGVVVSEGAKVGSGKFSLPTQVAGGTRCGSISVSRWVSIGDGLDEERRSGGCRSQAREAAKVLAVR